VFVDDQEWETTICYAAGLCGSLLLLAQACLLGMAPAPLLPTAALLAVLSVAINTAKARGWLDGPAAPTRLWGMWRGAVGCLGWAMVPQIAYLSLVLPATSGPDTLASSSWGPAAASICLGAALAALVRHRPSKSLARQGRRRRSGGLFDSWSVPAWTATLLFMLEPVAALVSTAVPCRCCNGTALQMPRPVICNPCPALWLLPWGRVGCSGSCRLLSALQACSQPACVPLQQGDC
jgi:hypothetical protein